MYEAVHARPDGESTVARLALTASEYGYDGIVVRNHGDSLASYDAAEITETYGIDVVDAVEVRADGPSRASGFVGNHRADRTIVAVHGGTVEMNRFAVEQPPVDVLAHPMAGDGDVNHVIAKAAADNAVHLEFSFGRVLRADGGRRVQAIRNLRKLRELVDAYDVPYVVSVDPTSHLHLRAPRDLFALGEVLGFSADQLRTGLREWETIAERNRQRMAEDFLEPGVRLGDDTDA